MNKKCAWAVWVAVAALCISACSAGLAGELQANISPTATQLPEATKTPTEEPTVTPTPQPTRTPAPLPSMELNFEALKLFQDVCRVIVNANPLAECPIVERERVPSDHRFVSFLDIDGKRTGLGLDLDASPTMLCGQEGFKCDWYLYALKPWWGAGGLMVGDHTVFMGQRSWIAFLKESGFTWPDVLVLPISCKYENLLEDFGIRFQVLWRLGESQPEQVICNP